MSEIPKAYEPQSVESKWYDFWLKQECFTADPARVSATRPAYSIVIPPPNVTGVLTLGHVLNNTIQDILARKARMDGKEVLWLPGTDHAGIATQNVVEKTLKKAGEIKHRDDLGREALVARIWEWKEKYGGIILQQLRALGASCDWTRTRFTMDPEYSRCVQGVFVDLYKKGLIYRGKRMVNWCPASLTALSDEEVTMKEQKGFMYHFRVEVVEAPGTFLTIATTRPETIPADTAVAVNPKDPRYQHLIGKHVYRALPLDLPKKQRVIPIIADDHVTFDFGTGVLKVTPAHDKADYEIGLRHQLPVIDILTPDGKMTAEAGVDLAGLDRFVARKKAMEMLEAAGAMEKAEPYVNNVGFSERADVPIEPRLSEQWFLKYPSVEESKASVANGRMVRIVELRGHELAGTTRGELRLSALKLAREKNWIGHSFPNQETGWQIHVRRKSLSHAFSARNTAAIKAVAALPELIHTAVLVHSEPHVPPAPDFKAVHHFMAALRIGDEQFAVPITVKELPDGQLLYDHKAKKITPGGKPLGPHPLAEKLGIQPAPGANWKLADLLEAVNGQPVPSMAFQPERWAKVYDHWLNGIQDWCISRQLWWGHRVPVWKKTMPYAELHDGSPLERAIYVLGETLSPNAEVSLSRGENDRSVLSYQWVGESKTIEITVATTSDNESRELDRLGFTHDPDVLDTWFSSWLWPFATMGWTGDKDTDAKNATLKAFYPTTDLVTGPDIIFFWVARMIMAGHEWMGDLPFRNVYFTGIIRDKQGRKMSKSLGNSPDPLDLIAKYGADALRFGVMRAAPLGQDVLFDEQTVELGRNFCNKLWNACRFGQMVATADSVIEGEIDPLLLTADDRWILLRLDQAIREVTQALADYKFSDATAALYRFFWSEYCDWYVEASKAAFYGTDEKLKANKLAVMDFVLGHLLRLFHPFLPFITEELWHGMGFSADMPAEQGGKTIMFAAWPKGFSEEEKTYFGLDETADKVAQSKYDLVALGRGLRRDCKIDPAKKVKFVLRPAGELPSTEVEVIKLLLNAEAVEVVAAGWIAEKGTPMAANALGELFLPLTGLVDYAAERERLGKELEKIRSEIDKVQVKLANPAFAEKVPAKVLEEHRQRLLDWQVKEKQAQAALDDLPA